MFRRTPALAAATLLLALTACSGSEGTTAGTTGPQSAPVAATTDVPAPTEAPTTTSAPTTTTEAPTTTTIAAGLTYADAGPYPVGFMTLTLPGGNEVAVWYPAVAGTSGEVTYDVRNYTPEAVKALLTADIPATFTIAAGQDAAPDPGPFPVVIYSHGYSGINVGSSFLTSHLASWGNVVAAPQHPSRDLAAATTFQVEREPQKSADDVLATIELMRTMTNADLDTIVLVGHSAGGGTVLQAAEQSADVDAYVSMASGAFAADGETPVLPNKPSLFLGGKLDAVIEAGRTQAAFDAAPAPSRLWIIDSVGHNGFDDFCTFGNGAGIIGIAEASGLGSFIDSNPSFRALGEDGCKPPNIPVTEAWPIIRHAVTAFVREQSGVDAPAIGLGTDAATSYPVTVDITEKLG
jgi:dienelactone hydrolase